MTDRGQSISDKSVNWFNLQYCVFRVVCNMPAFVDMQDIL